MQGILEPGSLYLTPEEPLDLSAYLLKTDAEETYLTNAGAEIIRTNHAGGTKISLNGQDKGGSAASFYAPVGSGSATNLLQSQGENKAPTWIAPDQIFNGAVTSILSNNLTPKKVVIADNNGKSCCSRSRPNR